MLSALVCVALGLALLVGLGMVYFLTRMFRKVEQGKALIISKIRKVDVTFIGAVVLPIVHKAEVMDISVKAIEIERSDSDGLICHDNIRADIKITFFVRVNKTLEDVIKVAQAIGTTRASHEETLQILFNAHNILDAQGIRKIVELTAIEHVRTNEFQRTEQKEITRQNVEARETILELERRQVNAEIEAETAHIRTDEQLGVQRETQLSTISLESPDAISTYFSTDPMVTKLRAVVAELRALGEVVRAEELDGRIKAADRRPRGHSGTAPTSSPRTGTRSSWVTAGSRSTPNPST